MRRRSNRNRRTRRSTAGSSAVAWLRRSSAAAWCISMPTSTDVASETQRTHYVNRTDDLRRQALKVLQELGVLMRQGHYDYGNGYHGRAYLNPHELFRQPSTIWRLGQDLIDILPGEIVQRTEVVAGPATGGALLAHTLAGLLDGKRA